MHGVNVSEESGIAEEFRIELATSSAIIFFNEFNARLFIYNESKSESDLILIFIFLQAYIECFLHENMRTIVELEFKASREWISERWRKYERDSVQDKLDHFCSVFMLSQNLDVQAFSDALKVKIQSLNSVRNDILHGHKISVVSSSLGEAVSAVKNKLTVKYLNKIINDVNDLGDMWNKLLDLVEPRCSALRSVSDFKFLPIK